MHHEFLPTHGWQANESVLPQACLSVVCLSVTFVHCRQTAIDGLITSSQAGRASMIWLRQAPNSIEIGPAAFEQWRI